MEENTFNLDVGCGSCKGHNPMPNCVHVDIQKTKWNKGFLEVIGTVYDLPFKNDAFEVVYANHLIEHLRKPQEAIRQLMRVCKEMLIIKVPHILSEVAKQRGRFAYDEHLHVFRKKWFAKILKHFNFTIKVNPKPFMLFLQKPYEIEVMVFKGK